MIINSIFASIDGEVNYYHQGALTTFIRLAGCNMHCHYCDTPFAMKGSQGKSLSADAVGDIVDGIGLTKVTITGGEPLVQRDAVEELIERLSAYDITIETNGSLPIINAAVSYIVDFKLGELAEKMYLPNFSRLNNEDFVKFVMASESEYEQARSMLKILKKECDLKAQVAFSPIENCLDPKILIGRMVEDKLNGVILNIQLHKHLSLKEPA